MKKQGLILLLFIPSMIWAQEKIYNTKELKAGFYKTYEEFINNAPSVTTPFTVREKSNMGEQYTFDTKDGSKVGKVFGFCDGIKIYVHGLRLEGFHKLDYVGPYSFFVFEQARYSVATAMLPDHLVIIDSDGTYRDGTVGFVEKFLLEKNPELGKEFESIADRKEKKNKRQAFIMRLNEKLKGN